jgi:hypothetical protein
MVALMATFAYVSQFASGPLLQRSIDQTKQIRISSDEMFLDLATRIPDGWFGTTSDDGLVGFGNSLPSIQQWWRNDTMHTHEADGYTCKGACNGYVRGAGFGRRCSTSERYFEEATNTTNDQTVFLINATMMENTSGSPFLRLRSEFISSVNDSCVATITIETCDLEVGIVEYPILIQGSAVSLRRDELANMTVDSVYTSPGDLLEAPFGTNAGPLSALRQFIYTGARLDDNATKTYHWDTKRSYYSGPGLLEDLFFQYVGHDVIPGGPPLACRLRWSSPTEYVVNVLHEFLFRTALELGNGTERQSFLVQRSESIIMFQVDARFLGVGLSAMACGIVMVSALMWGWWKLKRPVTLSPIETATVLRESTLQSVPRDATIKQVLTRASTLEIKAQVHYTV